MESGIDSINENIIEEQNKEIKKQLKEINILVIILFSLKFDFDLNFVLYYFDS